MKKALTILTTLAVVGAAVPRAHAGDREWAVAGKIMAGVGAGILISKALEPQPVYVAPPPVYATPAPVVVQQPATVVYQPAPTQQVVYQQTVVPGQYVVQQPVVVASAPIVAPAPIVYSAPVVYPAPVYIRPAPPVIGFRVSFGHHHRHW